MAVLEVRPLPDNRTFELVGELDMGSVDALLAAMNGLAPEGDVVLDMSKLSFMDSSGLRALLQLAGRRTGGSCLILLHPTAAVERVFAIALPSGSPGLRVELNGSARA